MKKLSAFAAALVLLLSFSASAAECENPIQSLVAADGQTGTPLRFNWATSGPVISQTLSGHDFAEPVVLLPTQRAYTYLPDQPGEKHATLTVVTECGTFSRDVTYHVQQCNVVQHSVVLSATAVAPGETFTASTDLLPGHTARWEVVNGTASSTTGESIEVTAANSGLVRVSLFVSRGNAKSNVCEARTTRLVQIQQACTINEPGIQTFPMFPQPGSIFMLSVNTLGPNETVTFSVGNATVVEEGYRFIEVTVPNSGDFTITVNVTKPGCSRSFTYTYTVTACEPTATISKVSESCTSTTLGVDFTGTAPWQGYWSDGQYFFTWEPHIERQFYAPGTFTISNFLDRDCAGTVSGSGEVTSGALLPPAFAIDDIASGAYYGYFTCPGLERVARLTVPMPAGVEVSWTVENGTIISGQGTDSIVFAGTNPGSTPVSATFSNAAGCTATFTNSYVVTQGIPQLQITVEPSAIDAGTTASVKVTRLDNYSVGYGLTSSLGDQIVPVGMVDEFTYEYQYRSTSGPGVATITANVSNACGDSNTATATLTINQGAPVTATATIHQFGTDCTNYGAYAEMTGTAPFSGTWSSGETFVSDYPYAYIYPSGPGTYTLTAFSDANGAGTVTGSATFDYTALPAPDFTYSATTACPNGILTATLTTPLPEGTVANWDVQGGTILSGQGTGTIEIQAGEFYVFTSVQITGPGACSPRSPWQYLGVSGYVQEPNFYVGSVNSGSYTDFTVWLDPNTANFNFENSLGDPMEIVSNPYQGMYVLRYTSTHGEGESVIRIYGTTNCGLTFEGFRTMQILPPPPPLPTATLTASTGSCGGGTITVTFTGQAPFSGQWSDTGETFTTDQTTLTRPFTSGGYYVTIYSFRDANYYANADSVLLPATTSVPYPDTAAGPYFCPGSNGYITVFNTDGYEVLYTVGGNGRIVSGDGTGQLVVTADEPGTFPVGIRLRSPEGCLGPEIIFNMTAEGPVAAPVITVPKTTLAPGETMDLTMDFGDSGLYSTLYWAASAGNLEFVSWADGVYITLRYTAPSEPGEAKLFAVAGTQCGQEFNESVTVTITP